MRPHQQQRLDPPRIKEYRVLLLDQRGTGLSTPINYQSLQRLEAAAQADYLSHFRADNIIRDAETIRAQLCPPINGRFLAKVSGFAYYII